MNKDNNIYIFYNQFYSFYAVQQDLFLDIQQYTEYYTPNEDKETIQVLCFHLLLI